MDAIVKQLLNEMSTSCYAVGMSPRRKRETVTQSEARGRQPAGPSHHGSRSLQHWEVLGGTSRKEHQRAALLTVETLLSVLFFQSCPEDAENEGKK